MNRTILLLAALSMPMIGRTAVIPVSGSISSNTNWSSGNIYLVTADVQVNAGATLTIDPGVVVKFSGAQYGARRLMVSGALNAQGTSGSPIIFTSSRDDGHGGDSNGDGAATVPTAGDWGYVKLSGSGSTVQYCQFWYGGYRDDDPRPYDDDWHNYMLWINPAYPPVVDIRDCLFRYASDTALRYEYSSSSFAGTPTISGSDIANCSHGIVLAGNELFQPTVSDNTFTATTYALGEEGAVAPQYSGNSLGARPWIALSGTIAGNVRWEYIPGMTYVLDGDVTVNAGATLTIDPGVVVKFSYQSSSSSKLRLLVNGALTAQGTSGSPIIFTSSRDDGHGGDSNGDGAATVPTAGDWGYVKLSGSGSTVQYCQFWYGGYRDDDPRPYDDDWHNYMLWINPAYPPVVDIRDCLFRYASDTALRYEYSSSSFAGTPTISGSDIANCSHGIVLAGNELFQPTVSDNTFTATTYALGEEGAVAPQYSGNSLGARPWIALSGTIAGNVRWEYIPGMTYVLDGDVTVNAGATLTIDPGVVVKFSYQSSSSSKLRLLVNGALTAQGTSGSPIIFTSSRDDGHGGDSNGDGAATVPTAGDWGYVKLSGSGSTVQYCQFWYGGYRDDDPRPYDDDWHNYMLWINPAYPPVVDIRDCLFRYASDTALRYEYSSSSFAGTPTISGSDIANCSHGIVLAGNELFQPTVSDNTFTATTYALGEEGAVAPQYSGNSLGARPWIALSGTIAGNVRWEYIPGMTYVLDGDVTVNAGATLTIDPGVVVKFSYQSSSSSKLRLLVNGALTAQGTSGSPIIFTSSRDDGHGGDSNGDGAATVPTAGDWGYVKLSGSGSTVQYCQFWYGGYRDDDPRPYDDDWHNYMLWIAGQDSSVRRCLLSYAYSVAINVESPWPGGTRTILSANMFDHCSTAICYDGGTAANTFGMISGNTFTNTAIAVSISRVGYSLAVYHNQFNGMTSYGVQNTDSSQTVDAQYNWWAAANGPGGQGPGSGSPVSQYVTYANWWTTPNQNTQGVRNVIAQRRGDSMLVDVYFDLIGNAGSHYLISLAASTTGGEPYPINPISGSLSGAVGSGIAPAEGLHILWDAAAGGGGAYTTTMRVKITADLE